MMRSMNHLPDFGRIVINAPATLRQAIVFCHVLYGTGDPDLAVDLVFGEDVQRTIEPAPACVHGVTPK